ncbi:helix-turn-helix domain-containing protein [Candidatus Gottesmanbacteria bacterium]|nr:helix-turn-helix domain-containing protein [Candidatus Gottesmanbacteria bacterium]
MVRIAERRKVIELRKQGATYSDIRAKINISKSTLSDWLRSYPLTKTQTNLLEKSKTRNKKFAIERFRSTMHMKKEKRLSVLYKQEKKRWISLNRREIELAGIFLYWGEGNKRLNGPISLNNTDPYVLKFTLYWLKSVFKIPKHKIRVHLHLYSDMDTKLEMKYWSRELNFSLSQFNKPYIKTSKRSDIDQKGYGHGTCGLSVSDVRLKEKIMMDIKAISDYYSSKI